MTNNSPKRYFLLKNGKKVGPLTSSDLKQMAADGKLEREDLVLIDGRSNPVKAKNFKDLFMELSTTKKPKSCLLYTSDAADE